MKIRIGVVQRQSGELRGGHSLFVNVRVPCGGLTDVTVHLYFVTLKQELLNRILQVTDQSLKINF